VKSGRRYEALATSPGKPDATDPAIYEIETDDPTTVVTEIGSGCDIGEMLIVERVRPQRLCLKAWAVCP
jgi:hypothetical protein